MPWREKLQEGLSGAASAQAVPAVSPVWLAEFRAKAAILLDFEFDPNGYADIFDVPLAEIVSTPLEDLALLTGRGEGETEAFLGGLRLVQIALDEPVFNTLTLRSFAPRDDAAPSPAARLEKLDLLYGPFEELLRPLGYKYNATPLAGTWLFIEPADAPTDLLEKRKEIYLEQAAGDDFRNGRKFRVVTVDAARKAIEISPALTESDGFTVGNAVLRANLVVAGHGEIRPQKVLGSGDAALSSQVFVFEVDNVSFVADATQPAGVRAGIEIEVDGRFWQQVPNLKDSRPADPHFSAHMTEDRFLKLSFGNGRNGKRLPNGVNNVRIIHRAGTGLAGNVSAGSLAKTVRPHRLIDSVRQPEDASGGNDMEPVESLRSNAPATVLTLERAVSLSDFANLAMSQSSVWQASAITQPTQQHVRSAVVVTVVPAGGGALGELEFSLADFLKSHSQPGVALKVVLFESLHFGLEVTAQIKSSEYIPAEVLVELRAALLQAFSLRNRNLGQDLYLSEVYSVVERVQGVANSRCVIQRTPGLPRLKGSELFAEPMGGVIYLHPEKSSLTLNEREFDL